MTPEQTKEFTSLNALAFDLARVKARQTDTKIPTWLCSSPQAKQKMRQEFTQEFNRLFGATIPLDEQQVEEYIEKNKVLGNENLILQRWKNQELEMEKAREAGSPHAFFV